MRYKPAENYKPDYEKINRKFLALVTLAIVGFAVALAKYFYV